MTDLVISVGSSLATDLFGSLNYPFRMRVEGNAFMAEAASLAGEADLDWLPPDSPVEDGGFEADFEPLLTATIEAYLESQSPSAFVTAEEDSEAAALIEPYLGDAGPSGPPTAGAVLSRMADDAAFTGKFETFLKGRLGAGIDWIEAELSQMPNAAMGNPLTLRDLRLAVRAKAKACIRVFGREICASATSPWIRFEGQQAALFLDVEGTKIFGRARVSDIEFVLKIRIFGRDIKIRIGVTGLLNRQLAGQRPLVADLGTVRITVPGLQRVYQPTSVSIPPSGSETTVVVDGRFSPG